MKLILKLLLANSILAFFVACDPGLQEREIKLPDEVESIRTQGLAEIAMYAGTVVRYGEQRKATLKLITVYEPWNRSEAVKSESGSDFYALKQNQVLTYRTGVYEYSQMNSLFWDAQNMSFLKATMTSQEWCGQTFKELRPVAGKLRFFFNSYWEGESSGTRFLEPPGNPGRAYLYDELPLMVRSSLMPAGNIRLYPMLMSSQVKRPYWDIGEKEIQPTFVDATVEKNQEETDNDNVEIITIQFDLGDKLRVDRFFVNDQRRLIRWERNDGGVFILTSTHRAKYWKLNQPGDELPPPE